MTASFIYSVCLLITVILIIVMAAKNYSNIDIFYCSIVLIVPVTILGYWLKSTAASVETAKAAFCILYLDSTILPILMMFSLLKALKITCTTWSKILAYGVAFLHLFTIWMCRNNDLYYSTFNIRKTRFGTITLTTDGPLKITHYIYLGVILATFIFFIVRCVLNRGKCSDRTIITYSSFTLAAIVIYVIELVNDSPFSALPIFYTIIDLYISTDYEFIHSHDIDCVVIDQQREHSKRGYIAFDKKKRLLCYNDNAVLFIPQLNEFGVDKALAVNGKDEAVNEVGRKLNALLDEYESKGEGMDEFSSGDFIYRATVVDFYMRRNGKKIGNLIEIQDVTTEHAYTDLIKEYSNSLKTEVNSQTDRIKYIQNKVVLGMATIIENRDMNTGGHVRRTSDIISVIVDEMIKQGRTEIDDRFADEIIRSAPMHDLGKISIDNKILCKPGKLTDEEYAIMKTHSAKSGEIVKAILSGVEDEHFINTAFCLARFHHERWDGRGYPEGLMEDEIPLEARIMAVADVYDALVSKRCYKEPMSFEKAAQIMVEGMGTQFDPSMKPIFLGCQKQLEEYYINVNAQGT